MFKKTKLLLKINKNKYQLKLMIIKVNYTEVNMSI